MTKKFNLFLFIKKYGIALVFGVAGLIILLVISSSFKQSSLLQEESVTEYVSREEDRLCELLKKIKGVGKCDVMITVDQSSVKNLAENKSSSSTQTLVLDVSGSQQTVTVSTTMPQVCGVAVVCEGAGSLTLKTEIVDLICKLYGISTAEVSVVMYH